MVHIFEGVGTTLATPFTSNGVDCKILEQHIQFLFDDNIRAIVVNDTAAENPTLAEEGKETVLQVMIKQVDHQVAIIAGTGTNNTAKSTQASLRAEGLGINGIILITPCYNKINQRSLIKHFEAITGGAKLPIVLYNVPSGTNMTANPEIAETLSRNDYVVVIKDATNDFSYHGEAKERVHQDEFAFYSDSDDNVVEFYNRGGSDVISVIANVVPKELRTLYDAKQDGKEVKENFEPISQLLDTLSVDVSPVPVKALASHSGFGNYELKLPLLPLEKEKANVLVDVYRTLKAEE